MTKAEFKTIYDYLLKGSHEFEAYFEKGKNGDYTGKFKEVADCKLLDINNRFSTNITCRQFDTVASGEGNEKEKIDSVYSSSLQSLLAFHSVSENNPIHINGEKFTDVIFEYKNKVIGYPSSVDVVLLGEHCVAFIESKFLEIIRDSFESKKDKKYRKVVGISYYGEKENGYKTLGLSSFDLKAMGIDYPDDGDPYLLSVKGRSEEKQAIGPIKDANYVYPEGIKQMLSHIIGIQSFKRGDSPYTDVDPIGNHGQYTKVMYIELYNGFPGLEDESTRNKLKDFKAHAEKVKEVIESKKDQNGKPTLVDDFLVMTYQDLFKENPGYKLSDTVKNYFHFLNEE